MIIKSKISTIFILLVTVFAGAVFAYTFVHAALYAPESELSVPAGSRPGSSVQSSQSSNPAVVVINAVHKLLQPTPAPVTYPSNYPNRLIIPSLNVNANVQYVGISLKGNMGVPNNFTDVGWYRYGTIPGFPGSAVIDGHVNNALGLDGVFSNLAHIQSGDDIYVVTRAGTKLHFKVTTVESYPYDKVPVDTIFNQTGPAELRLITCDGTWISDSHTYDTRIVVTALLEK